MDRDYYDLINDEAHTGKIGLRRSAQENNSDAELDFPRQSLSERSARNKFISRKRKQMRAEERSQYEAAVCEFEKAVMEEISER